MKEKHLFGEMTEEECDSRCKVHDLERAFSRDAELLRFVLGGPGPYAARAAEPRGQDECAAGFHHLHLLCNTHLRCFNGRRFMHG